VLDPMGRAGVLEAIKGLARENELVAEYGLRVDDEVAEVIANDLLADSGSPVAPTLQILLTAMWERARKKEPRNPHFTVELFKEVKVDGYHLQDFLRRKQASLAEKGGAEDVQSGLVLDVLLYHTEILGTTVERSAADLKGEYGERAARIDSVVKGLR